MIAACTTAWDAAHAVIATMGDRFVLIRPSSYEGREKAGRQALKNSGKETEMRSELAAAVAGLMQTIDANAIYVLTDDDAEAIVAAADLVTLARTGVERDYRGDVIDAHDPEMPTRFAKQLIMIMRGAVAIGITHDDALRLVFRCARDSMPQLRLTILRDVAEHPGSLVIEIRRRVQKPRLTVDRTLAALHILGLLKCDEEEVKRGDKPVQERRYSLADGVNLDALQEGRTAALKRGGCCATGCVRKC